MSAIYCTSSINAAVREFYKDLFRGKLVTEGGHFTYLQASCEGEPFAVLVPPKGSTVRFKCGTEGVLTETATDWPDAADVVMTEEGIDDFVDGLVFHIHMTTGADGPETVEEIWYVSNSCHEVMRNPPAMVTPVQRMQDMPESVKAVQQRGTS